MTILSIIIVNYKTPALVLDCLSTIYQFPSGGIEIIVVDNDSGDNSRELILAKYPEIRWIEMGYNSGFARANNEGIRQSTGQFVLLLNSDTLIIDNAINRAVELFSKSSYVACGVQLLNADGSSQISGNYFMKGSLNNLLPLPFVGKVLRWIALNIQVKKPHVPDSNSVVEVDWINGAFLMVKKETIDRAGMMDEDFFLYAEEAEWCARLRQHGPLAIFGQCKVVHLQGESSASAFQSEGKGYQNLYDRKGLQIMLSNMLRIRKQHGVGWLMFHYLIFTLTIPVSFLCSILELFFSPARGKRDLKNTELLTVNIIRLWKYFPKLIINKPFFYKVL